MSQHTIFFGDMATFVYDDQSRTFTPLVVEWVSPTPTLDKIEAEKEQFLPCGICGTSYGPDELCFCQNCGAVLVTQSDVSEAIAEGYLQPAEPTRPALDWNKPTPFDPFKGWEPAKSHTQDQQASNNHALQRCADFDGLVMKVNPLKGA